jgi:2-(3-amino-3-carboxypropyl)histidine synthase
MYNLELGRVVELIKQKKARQVLIQLPDGLKNKAGEVVDFIEKNTGAKAFIWLSSCFGGCDIPFGADYLKIDLIVQFGHNKFNKEEW